MPTKTNYRRRRYPYDLTRWPAREVILARLDQIGKSKYWLVSRVSASEAVVYRFLCGRALTSWENVLEMMRAVGLGVEVWIDPDFVADDDPAGKPSRGKVR